jgi:flagellar biosynthesis/type III secretory pathway ATPase
MQTDPNSISFIERREKPFQYEQGWHLDKKVPITMILTMIAMAISGFWAFADLKKDVELLKANSLTLHAMDMRQTEELREAMSFVREQIKSVNDKLDRLIERNGQRK